MIRDLNVCRSNDSSTLNDPRARFPPQKSLHDTPQTFTVSQEHLRRLFGNELQPEVMAYYAQRATPLPGSGIMVNFRPNVLNGTEVREPSDEWFLRSD
jgi:hypothetical protein